MSKNLSEILQKVSVLSSDRPSDLTVAGADPREGQRGQLTPLLNQSVKPKNDVLWYKKH